MLATMLLLWQLSAVQCDGTPERLFRYEVRYNVARVMGQQPCDQSDPASAMCPAYTPFAWKGPYFTVQPYFQTNEVDVGVGEVLTWEVTAVDEAGNRDCGIGG